MKHARYRPLAITANRVVVFDLQDRLRLAWQDILNSYPTEKHPEPIALIDAAMTAHNFHKQALSHIISDSGMNPEDARDFLLSMRDTFSLAINTVIEELYDEHGTFRGGHQAL